VHKAGSFCAVVVGTVLFDGRHVPLPYHLVPLMEELGWEFHQDIIWSKCTGGVKRAGSTITNPFPGYFYPNLMIEYILVFRKPGDQKIFQGRSREEKEESRVEIESVFTRDVANNVWHIAPVPPKQLEHPCPFPEELAYRVIRWYSYKGDVVLDPFCGVGTTPKVAARTGRRWIGYEIKERYAELTRARVKEALHLRKQLIVDLKKIEYRERLERKSAKRAPFPRQVKKRRSGAAPEDLFE
jgi:site-specific DNA-methyltransferase (adenine-specific)